MKDGFQQLLKNFEFDINQMNYKAVNKDIKDLRGSKSFLSGSSQTRNYNEGAFQNLLTNKINILNDFFDNCLSSIQDSILYFDL